jgi:ABC-type branched-subunit amino acid transport system permease subunit
LALLERMSGQICLAQLAFVAVGGSTFSHLAHGAGLPWGIAVAGASVIAVPVGALLAIPAIRLSGLYLALATLGFGLLMDNLVYGTTAMFGAHIGSLPSPRPSFAQGDKAYYYLVLAFVVASVALVVEVRRGRLGRLLRAMSDSQTALVVHGMNVTVIKVLAFCLSAFLAGLAGALLGPVTGQIGAGSFDTFASLTLVVVLALQSPLPEIPASLIAAAVLIVLPSYLQNTGFTQWLPVLFGGAAVAVAMAQAAGIEAATLKRPAPRQDLLDRIRRTPVNARLTELRQSRPVVTEDA